VGRVVITSLRGHKRRVLSMCSAVLLGVAFLAGTLILGDTMRSGFGDMFEEANAGTDALVRSAHRVDAAGWEESPPIDAAVLDQVAAVEGVGSVAPVVEASGQLAAPDGDAVGGDGPPTVAGNWVTEPGLNPYQLREGRAPEGPGEVVVDARSADAANLEVGDPAVVRIPEAVEVTVVGVAGFGDSDSMGGATFVAFATDVAQELLLGDPGALTAVAVGGTGDVSQDEIVGRLASVVPGDVEVISGQEYSDEQLAAVESDFLGMLEAFLLVFAGIALVVGTFSIYNTFSIVVAQRTRESAMLRSLGASRRQVLGAQIAEALFIGLVAAGRGVVAGAGLARGLVALFGSLGVDLPADRLIVSSGSVLVAVVVGVVVTLVAGLAPAVKASRVAPLAALREVSIDRSGTSWLRAGAGLALTALGAVGALAGAAVAGDLPLTGLGALALIVGTVMVGPVAARPVSAVLGAPLARLRGMSGGLARANAMRNPSRTAGTAAALMVGVAVVGMFTVVGASFRAYVDDTVDRSFVGDLVWMNDSWSGVGFSPEVTGDLAALDEVDAAVALAVVPVEVDGRSELASAVVGPDLSQVYDAEMEQGAMGDLGEGTVALSSDAATQAGATVGDTVPVAFGDRTVEQLEVVGVFVDDGPLDPVLVNETTWREHTTQLMVDMVFIDLVDGVGLDEGRAAIEPLAAVSGVEVQDNEELAATIRAEVDESLAVIYVMLVLAVVIALMSIATTLSLSIHERTRELGLLRAVGQSRRQLRTMVRGEALVVAAYGTVGGLGLGAVLGWALTRAVSEEEGFRFVFSLPVGQLLVVAAVGVTVGLLASLRPARRAAKLDILQALATE
jgi:putative ABC transport system permease protein